MVWKLREASNAARTTVNFLAASCGSSENHLTQEYGMKMSTEWKEFKSEAGSLVLYKCM